MASLIVVVDVFRIFSYFHAWRPFVYDSQTDLRLCTRLCFFSSLDLYYNFLYAKPLWKVVGVGSPMSVYDNKYLDQAE